MHQPHLTPGEDLLPIVQEAGWASGWAGQVWKISPPLGFDPWTIQPVGSHYTDYATRPPEAVRSVTILLSTYHTLRYSDIQTTV
jgi:hypothetical protein